MSGQSPQQIGNSASAPQVAADEPESTHIGLPLSTADNVEFESLVQEDARPADAALPASQLLVDRFHILRELGRGGMARVYLAEDIGTGRQVAIKMMQTRLQGTARQRFTREFSTIASVKHPHCLEVFEYGESDHGPYFAMELFAGQPATALIGQPLPTVLKALYQLAEAVDYVHSRRIIHRDIKPGNILVRARSDNSGFDVRLTDFGLAKFADSSSSLSGEGDFLGTVAYCAPEQVIREDLDYRCDLYSFGIVCYEILAGRHPFAEARGNVPALIAKHLRDMPEQLRVHNRELPPAIEFCVMKMLAKDAGARPKSTQEFRNSIIQFLNWNVSRQSTETKNDGHLLVGTFVSREREKLQLEGLLTRNLLLDGTTASDWLDEQPPFLAVLTGEAGLGKSVLLRQAARAAIASGACVYEGRCFDGNLAPFQPFVEVLRQLLAQHNARAPMGTGGPSDFKSKSAADPAEDIAFKVRQVVRNYAAELLRMAPELRDVLPGETFTAEETSQQADYILRAVARMFVDLSRTRRICILLEDLHWADNSSLSLLVHLGVALRTARREATEYGDPPPRLFVCATTRPESDYPSISEPMNHLRQQNSQRTIELTQFDAVAVQSLAAALLGALPDEIDPELIDRMTQQCFGNPFYISQTIREWRTLGRIAHRDGTWRVVGATADAESIPDSVRAAMRERVRGLESLPGKMLSVAAVIGAVVDIELLRDVLGNRDQFEFLDALDLLLARQILSETGTAHRVAFTHDLVREAALERQSSNQQTQRLHEAVALRLESLAAAGKPVPTSKLAEHFLAADIREKAFHYLLLAGTEAVTAFAHQDAIPVLEKARDILPESADEKAKFQLYRQLAKAYAATTAPIDAESLYREAVRSAETPIERAETLMALGEVVARRRQPEVALNIFREALSEVRHPMGVGPVSTAADIVKGVLFTFLLPETMRRKLWLRKRSQRECELAFQIVQLASHSQLDVSLFRYLQLSQRCFILSHRTGKPEDLATGYVKHAINMSLFGTPWFPLRFANRAVQLATTAQRPDAAAFTKVTRAAVRGWAGDELSQAIDDALSGLKQYERLGESFTRQLMTHVTRHLLEFHGDTHLELQVADEELRMAALSDDWERATWGHYGRADALARAGRLRDADTALNHAWELLGNHPSLIARPVAFCVGAAVSIQNSDYETGLQMALQSQRGTERGLGLFVLTAKAYPLAVESGLGPDWHNEQAHDEICRDHRKMRQLTWVLWKTLGIGLLFLVVRAHCYRARGRHAFVSGKRNKAIRLFNRSVAAAERLNSPYELARALLDRAHINPCTAAADRMRGEELLAELDAVLPQAERAPVAGG